MNEAVLELAGVSKRFGDFTAVNDISLAIPQGSIYGFLGPNGAGKTTTIRMILDILRPDSGSISVLGRSSALDVRHKIGYLPEEKGLYKKMKVWGIIAYFATLKGMDKKTARLKAHALLERYGLGDFAEAKVESLSKGMGQKVQVLSAVVHEPELVILDEPFSGLDPVNQTVLETLIRDMAANGQTVIFSTHVMQHAERLCDRVLLIARGKKIFDGTLREARAIIPRRVQLECAGDTGPLQTLDGVVNVIEKDTDVVKESVKESVETSVETAAEATPEATATAAPSLRRWEVQLRESANPQSILQCCFEAGIALNRFDYTEPSLHDVFVHLVGSDALDKESAA